MEGKHYIKLNYQRSAEKQIPKNSHKTTTLFLYATAGVRRLQTRDPYWLLNHAWSILKSSPCVCQSEWVKIITGMEEAYYGWIALNYETVVLGAIPKKPTFGALDLGGSSLQVTFESNEPVQNKTNLNLSIGLVNHHLRMPKVSKEDLIHGNVEIRHPCLHTGYKSEYFCSQCASLNKEARSPRYGEKDLDKKGNPVVPVQLIGSPNWAECSAVAKVAVNLSEWSALALDLIVTCNHPHPCGQFL